MMDARLFDRIAKALVGRAPRRQTLKLTLAGVLAATIGKIDPDAEAKSKKKRCRKTGQTCTANHKCCNDSGLIRCREFPVQECGDLTGFHCCGLEGAICDPKFGFPGKFGNCSCCDPLFCGKHKHGKFRCQTEDT
jgi:hypothetical protein